jgi:hypothetical protein
MIFGVLCISSERRLIEAIDHVRGFETVLAGNSFDIAVVAGGTEAKGFEDWKGLREALLHIPDDRVTADQLIESKHWRALFGEQLVQIAGQ